MVQRYIYTPQHLAQSQPTTMTTMTMVSLDTLGDSITPFRPPEATLASTIARHKPVERPNHASLTILPEELIVKILEWCDCKGVLACQLVRGPAGASRLTSR
jgi:hypothetical protein